MRTGSPETRGGMFKSMSQIISSPRLNASMEKRSATCSVSSRKLKGTVSSLNSFDLIFVKSRILFASSSKTSALN